MADTVPNIVADRRIRCSQRIQLLPPEEARKIAAGEVIDRPAALVREFLDNAIDAGGEQIEVLIEEGGGRRTEVIDDGGGMEKDDLELCVLTHATSKIRSLDDLASSETLGFRGEALAAAAAVARLEILTSIDGREAWKLDVGPGERNPQRIEQARRNRGTSVRALGLFDTIPARKRFLKREGTEAGLCRQALIDKALAFPERSFRFTQDGKLKTWLPAVNSLKERFTQCLMDSMEGGFLHEIHAAGPGFSVTVVIGGPELYRNDRRQQYVFANHRRIQDYALVQAMEYGVQGWFPNGTHPVGAVYVEIDPALADFNIHPAKREVRFADPGAIHHVITQILREFARQDGARQDGIGQDKNSNTTGTGESSDFFGNLYRDKAGYSGNSNAAYFDNSSTAYPGNSNTVHQSGNNPLDRRAGALALEALLEHRPDFALLPGRETAYPREEGDRSFTVAEAVPPYGGRRLIGRLFELFLLVEAGDELFIIDQHAAHERILYDAFLSKPIPKQELLVPIPFSAASADEDRFLAGRSEDLAKLGIVIESDAGFWRITALPANWKLGDAETVKEILDLHLAGENIAERWAATLACHAAVRDGDYLDDTAALALAEEALRLPVPRCPHGRPVWTTVTKESLYKAVRRL
ncbi:DNA mismatch repair protein MutL [Spirochaetia bacterium]|nr:DNA mismatch repair protein MutL [Spirochaetia bacterium]